MSEDGSFTVRGCDPCIRWTERWGGIIWDALMDAWMIIRWDGCIDGWMDEILLSVLSEFLWLDATDDRNAD